MRITSLWFYPVKGCRGVETPEVDLVETGLAGDRQFVIVDEKGLFVTQRESAELARIEVHYRGNNLALSMDGHSDFTVPLDAPEGQREIQVWSAKGVADDVGDDAAAWLRSALGRPLRLMRAGRAWQRTYTFEGTPQPLAFADGYPLLVISEASLVDLNARLPAPVPMTRFRPNIVVDGLPAYAEDTLDRAQCGGVVLRGVKPCVRCVVTTTDQVSGERDARSEPLRTLARYRRSTELRGAIFGMNVAVTAGAGTSLHVGDTFTTTFR